LRLNPSVRKRIDISMNFGDKSIFLAFNMTIDRGAAVSKMQFLPPSRNTDPLTRHRSALSAFWEDPTPGRPASPRRGTLRATNKRTGHFARRLNHHFTTVFLEGHPMPVIRGTCFESRPSVRKPTILPGHSDAIWVSLV
jgi:hypothetical protein